MSYRGLRWTQIDEDRESACRQFDHLGGMTFWELSQDYDDELLDIIVRAMRR